MPLIKSLKRLYSYRSLILMLTIRNLQNRYVGTVAGMIWSILNPLATVFVFWFVFSLGFRVQPVENIPFVVIFLLGFLPWTLFSETLMTSVGVVTNNVNLVKKTVFPTEILPIANLLASCFTHVIMLGILAVILTACRISISFSAAQFLFYFAGLALFSLGLSWLLAALNVFYRDIGQIMIVLINVWFWMTPISWLMTMIPGKWKIFVKINPMYYIVDGYQSSFVYHVPFWSRYQLGIYFWSVCLATFVGGGLLFKKLKPEFADVL